MPVKFGGVYDENLKRAPFVDATARQLGTWVRLFAHASRVETEIIKIKREAEREWLINCNVTKADLEDAVSGGLVEWRDDGLWVAGYDHDGQRVIDAKRQANPSGSPLRGTHRHPNGNPHKEGKGREGKGKGGEGREEAFAAWWDAYPRKVGKGDAEKAWKQTANDRPEIAEMVATLGWQRISRDWTKDGGAFVPHPGTYLRAHRWADERPGVARPAHNAGYDPGPLKPCAFHAGGANKGVETSTDPYCNECSRLWKLGGSHQEAR